MTVFLLNYLKIKRYFVLLSTLPYLFSKLFHITTCDNALLIYTLTRPKEVFERFRRWFQIIKDKERCWRSNR